ncbi:MAG: L-serine dehydratase [Planctomycetota bacterium]|jgi:L-serine dehydratase
MERNQPSIFNDVIGPVMRGASSSHCAASVRIGRLAHSLMGGHIDTVLAEFDQSGSLATTHESQGSDMGLVGGFLGWDLTDERLLEFQRGAEEAGLQFEVRITHFDTKSPNIYKLTLQNGSDVHQMVADSVGGGMIEVTEIDGVPLWLDGGRHETLLYFKGDGSDLVARLDSEVTAEEVYLRTARPRSESSMTDGDRSLKVLPAQLVQVRGSSFLDPELERELQQDFGVVDIRRMSPVLPVQGALNIKLPFTTCEQMLAYNESRSLSLWELALHYESARSGMDHERVFSEMREVVEIMRTAIELGLEGTQYHDRILPCQTPAFQQKLAAGALLDGGMLNSMILQVSAMMEVKSSMGVIVAAPTAGACAGLPAAVIAAGQHMNMSIDEMTRGMLAAGMVGIFIATRSTFAAEVGGCQAECGAGSGMAAAALVTMMSGTAHQAVSGSSMALQSTLGLICDPVAGRVEVPCLGRNVLAASNALSCANMALAGFDAVIPLDEVIDAMDRIGRSMPCELRCTCLGGLSTTKTSKAIEGKLKACAKHP